MQIDKEFLGNFADVCVMSVANIDAGAIHTIH